VQDDHLNRDTNNLLVLKNAFPLLSKERLGEVFFLLFLFVSTFTHAQNLKLEDLAWNESMQKGLSRTADQALGMSGIEWKHGESEHFIYHFVQRWMGERACSEAETYYDLIKRDLKITEDKWELKGHIFLFESDEVWNRFKETVNVDRWSGGVCIGNEFFLHSKPGSNPFTGSTLPHEMTHLIVNRFVRGQIPRWLNEGLAEQQSAKHFNGYTKPKGFNFMPRLNIVAAENYIPLDELINAKDYPSDPEKVSHFYTESVRMVQFLVEDHPKQDFLEFLQNIADGMKFENAFDRVYGSIYPSIEVFETKFKDVAIAKVKLVK
jgi:hypothetical protein